MRSPVLASATALAAVLFSITASAADPTTADCLAAADRSADLRPLHKLRETRDKLLICSAASCPGDIREECVHRLTQVNAAMPTIVFETKDAAGNDLAAVKVTMDGQLLATRLEGVALSIDPGEHSFTFVVAGQPTVQKSLVIREGEKGRRERIVIGAAAEPAASTGDGAPKELGASTPAMPARSHVLQWSLVAGGAALGVAGAVLMAVEAGQARDANDRHDKSAYDTASTVWTVGLAGSLLGAGAVAVGGILFATATHTDGGANATASPLWIGLGPSDLRIGGSW